MDDLRRAEILAAFERRSASFDRLARRRQHAPSVAGIAPPSGARGGGAVGLAPELTERMVDVLALIADGYSNKDISSQLAIGAETVKSHIARLLTTLGATNRAHAVTIAFRSGLLDGSDSSWAA